MGREVRMVPPNFEHPRYASGDAPSRDRIGEYRSCRDEDYETAAKKWIEEFGLWQNGEHESQGTGYFWEYASPPEESACRPSFHEPPIWFQLYETVSEGTPVSPPFPTQEELARWLSENGDFGQQLAFERGWDRTLQKPTYDQAMKTLKIGFAFSMIAERDGATIKILGPYEQAE